MIRLLKISLLSGFFIISMSCRKETSKVKLGSIDLSGGFALVVPEYPDNSSLRPDQEPDFAKLYKITKSDTLQKVKYLSSDGQDMEFAYIPEAIYDLNASYLFITLTRRNQIPKVYESYLIQKDGGKAFEIIPEFHPNTLINNELTDNYFSKAFCEGAANYFYCFTNRNIESINLNGTDNFPVSNQTIPDVSNSDFVTDIDGNIFIEGKLVTASGSQDVSVFKKGLSFVSKALDKGFYVATMNDTSMEINHIFMDNNTLKTEFIRNIGIGTDPWTFRGSATFRDLNCTMLVFDKGIINITPHETNLLPLASFSLTSIELFDHSDKNFYIAGTNVLHKKVFMLINPSTKPITFTHTLPPNTYDYKNLHVTTNNVVTFFATRIADNREVFGYIPESSNVMVKINHHGLKVKQVVAYK